MHGVRFLGFELRVKWGGERLLLDCLLVFRRLSVAKWEGG